MEALRLGQLHFGQLQLLFVLLLLGRRFTNMKSYGVMGRTDMIFQEIKNMLIDREYAEIDDEKLGELMYALSVVMVAGQHGEYLPDEYISLRDWVYNRVAKNLEFRNTGYVNEHFCVGVIWGMLRLCDESLFVEEWKKYVE